MGHDDRVSLPAPAGNLAAAGSQSDQSILGQCRVSCSLSFAASRIVYSRADLGPVYRLQVSEALAEDCSTACSMMGSGAE